MKPGRELDALVAKALGWRQLSHRLWHDGDGQERWIDDREDAWSPSTDIAAAWAVWHKLMERFFCCKISFISQRVPKCRVALYSYAKAVQFNDPSFEAVGETAMHAICLAALEAAGVEVGDD